MRCDLRLAQQETSNTNMTNKTAEIRSVVTLMEQPISVHILFSACSCANRSDGSLRFLVRSTRQPMPPVKSTSASSVTPPSRASYEPNNLSVVTATTNTATASQLDNYNNYKTWTSSSVDVDTIRYDTVYLRVLKSS